MNNEEIMELVKEYFKVGCLRDDGSSSEYYGTPEDFICFAHNIRSKTFQESIDILGVKR